MNILVTGGARYIGSRICVELVGRGNDVTVADNFSSSSAAALDLVQSLCGRAIDVVAGDVRDNALLRAVFRERRIDAVIHLSGLKTVGGSGRDPLKYYDNNAVGTIDLCRSVQESGIRSHVLSSSATIYETLRFLPLTEVSPVEPTSPYGWTKLVAENIGTSRGYTVREIVAEIKNVSARPVSRFVAARRPGDVDARYADASLAGRLLGWRAKRGLRQMCEDAWRWQRSNPDGYGIA